MVAIETGEFRIQRGAYQTDLIGGWSDQSAIRGRDLPANDGSSRAVKGVIAAAPSVVGVLTEVLILLGPLKPTVVSRYKIAQGAVYSPMSEIFCSRGAALTHCFLC
jgi:hypothetical protein